MDEKEKNKQKKKGFFAKWMEKIDKKIEEKSQKSSCCGGEPGKGKGSSCC